MRSLLHNKLKVLIQAFWFVTEVSIDEILAPFCSYQEKFILDNHLDSKFVIDYHEDTPSLGGWGERGAQGDSKAGFSASH